MRLISPLLKHVVYPGLARSGYLKRIVTPGPVAVTYHGVLPPDYEPIDSALDGSLISPDVFEQQIALLQRRYHVISPQEFLDWRAARQQLPDNAVLLTCDDGLKNTRYMLPILKASEAKCLFFVTGASLRTQPSMLWHEELFLLLLRIPKPFKLGRRQIAEREITSRNLGLVWWRLVKQLSAFDADVRQRVLEEIRQESLTEPGWHQTVLGRPGARERFLVLEHSDLQELVNAGHSLAAHSLSHPVLSRAPDRRAWAEIVGSREGLEKATAQPVWAFAYPFGNPDSVSGREMSLAERAGFQCAFMNTEGGSEAGFSWYSFPRVHVTSTMSLAEFEAHVCGLHSRLQRSVRQAVGA